MPTYNIEGIDVDFPHQAYPCQIEYMRKVILALEQEENALLESPTGTGKTLCLLCATLAWREAKAAKLAGGGGGGHHPYGFGAAFGGQAAGQSNPAAAAAAAPGALPLIVYASRTHSQLAQVVRELRATRYRVRTTVLGSRGQMCLHPKVSKMGGGAANFACRGLVLHKQCQWHSKARLERVVADLTAPPAPNAAAAGTGAQPAAAGAFGALGSGGGSRDSAPASAATAAPAGAAPCYDPPDIEDLLRLGRAANVCPYFLSRDLATAADVVFAPYNYLLDAAAGRQLVDGLRWEGAVVILDEAHNVQDVCKGAASFDLTAQQRAAAVADVERAVELCAARAAAAGGGGGALLDGGALDGAALADLRERLEMGRGILLELDRRVAALDVPDSGLARPGEALLELLAGAGLTAATLTLFSGMLQQAARLLADEELGSGRAGGARVASAGLDALIEALSTAFASQAPLWRDGPPASRGYRMFVHRERVAAYGGLVEAPTLSYWCFVPGIALHRLLARRVRSLVLTSGTLSPLESFAAELQVGFRHSLANPHIVGAGQVWVGVVPAGPTGAALNSSYATRSSPRYREDLGHAIANFARVVPDGLLVFFPSYAVLTDTLAAWKQPPAGGGASIWERICRCKAPVVEPRDAASLPAAIAEFKARLDDPNAGGAALFAVCRGKVSEGLDFSDRAGRAVVITGMPFGATTDPNVRLQRQVLDDELRAGAKGLTRGRGVSGEQWYVQQAARAVNQAMGRVIRHRWDYGAVVLADERFLRPQNQRQLSAWLREHLVEHPSFGAAIGSLTKFFKDKASFAPPPEVQRQQREREAARAAAAGARTSAFDMLRSGGNGGANGGQRGGGAFGLLTAGGGALAPPRAIDVSGFATFAGAGGGGGGGLGGLGGLGGGGGGSAVAGVAAGGGDGSIDGRGAASGAASGSVGGGSSGGGGAPRAGRSAPAGGPSDALLGKLLGRLPAPAAAGAAAGSGGSGSVSVFARRPGIGGVGRGASQQQQPALGLPARPRRPQIAIEYGGGGGGDGAGGGDGDGGSEPPDGAPAAAVVGPAHLIARHNNRQNAGNGSGGGGAASGSASPTGGGGEGAASPGRDRPADPDAAMCASNQPPAAQGQQQQKQQQQQEEGSQQQQRERDDGKGGSICSDQGPQREDGAAEVAAATTAAPPPHQQEQEQEQPQPPAAADPRAFMDRARRELPPERFARFRALLAAYRQSRDVGALIDGAVAEFGAPETCHLLAPLEAFLPRPARAGYAAVVAERFAAAAAAAAPAAATAAAAAPPRVAAAAAPAAGRTGGSAAAATGGSLAAAKRPTAGGGADPAAAGAKRPRPAAAGPAGANGAPGPLKQQWQQQLQKQQQQRPQQQQQQGVAALLQRPQQQQQQQQQQQPLPHHQSKAREAAVAAARAAPPRPCVACRKAPAESAHRAPCGHVACYGCWLGALSAGAARGAKCPKCGLPVRRQQLTKVPFA